MYPWRAENNPYFIGNYERQEKESILMQDVEKDQEKDQMLMQQDNLKVVFFEYTFLSTFFAGVTILLTFLLVLWPFSLFFVLWILPLSVLLTLTFGGIVLGSAIKTHVMKGFVRLVILSLVLAFLASIWSLSILLTIFHRWSDR